MTNGIMKDDDIKKVDDIHLSSNDKKLFVEINSFLRENNLLRTLNPCAVASYEQLSFMVVMDRDQVYVPCSDEIFFALMHPEYTPLIAAEYRRVWRRAMRFLCSLPLDKEKRKLVYSYCRKRMERIVLFHDVIPSRLLKRITTFILLSATDMQDPWRQRKSAVIEQHVKLALTERFTALLNEMPALENVGDMMGMRHALDNAEFDRLLCLSAYATKWHGVLPDDCTVRKAFAAAEKTMAAIREKDNFLQIDRHATVMLLCESVENLIYDLLMVRFFIKRGFKVIYAVKELFFYDAPTMEDILHDPILSKYLPSFYVCRDKNLSKNALLQQLREWRMVVVDDGTRESLNLVRASVTFARAWKEADLILAHGKDAMQILHGTSHEFTRDILVWNLDEGKGCLDVQFKRHSQKVRKFSETDLQNYANDIINEMRDAQKAGRPVIFYSCIIGSIPGQTDTALRLAKAIVGDMRKNLPTAYIINPATHFVEGMDADDLMYMWEAVQRSGYINIWYFQTAEDIEKGFRLLGEPTPECWIGKDASYSTGCTKEMAIAMDVQKHNREMQILGPDPATFFRRGEYGVGKYFDASLKKE